ncbi:MAG: AlkA N-terminal domain-containing protein [Coriobacteriia bacterium]|nr:AlkA N-terminal domain-containing protein [Coriobacteriia bacterium]
MLDQWDPSSPNAQDELHEAFTTQRSRADGQVFVGVTSTKIYCRPTCHARSPKRENRRYFTTTAAAEAAGFRPCLMCRPELAPGMPANSPLANATQVEPDQIRLTEQLHLAKMLAADTLLPLDRVAHAAGFANEDDLAMALKRHYRLDLAKLRRPKKDPASERDAISFRLCYRPPYRFDDLLGFFRMRQLEGVERVDDRSYARTVRIPAGGAVHAGWIEVTNDPRANAVRLTMSRSLLPVASQVVQKVRRLFDLDCDPQSVHEGLTSLDDLRPGARRKGTRLPGCFDPFETCCRAILGQQVTVVAANKLAARIVSAYGPAVQTPFPELSRAWPSPQEMLALGNLQEKLGVLGTIKTRSACIGRIAEAMTSGNLPLDDSLPAPEQMERLLALKGIGPWTANYIAMRVLSYPDAFLESDAGVKHALPDLSPKERLTAAESWRPWRSYAVVSLWNSLSPQND